MSLNKLELIKIDHKMGAKRYTKLIKRLQGEAVLQEWTYAHTKVLLCKQVLHLLRQYMRA